MAQNLTNLIEELERWGSLIFECRCQKFDSDTEQFFRHDIITGNYTSIKSTIYKLYNRSCCAKVFPEYFNQTKSKKSF